MEHIYSMRLLSTHFMRASIYIFSFQSILRLLLFLLPTFLTSYLHWLFEIKACYNDHRKKGKSVSDILKEVSNHSRKERRGSETK